MCSTLFAIVATLSSLHKEKVRMQTRVRQQGKSYPNPLGITAADLPFRSSAELKALKAKAGASGKVRVVDPGSKKSRVITFYGIESWCKQKNEEVYKVTFANGNLSIDPSHTYKPLSGIFDLRDPLTPSYTLLYG